MFLRYRAAAAKPSATASTLSIGMALVTVRFQLLKASPANCRDRGGGWGGEGGRGGRGGGGEGGSVSSRAGVVCVSVCESKHVMHTRMQRHMHTHAQMHTHMHICDAHARFRVRV